MGVTLDFFKTASPERALNFFKTVKSLFFVLLVNSQGLIMCCQN